MLKFGLALCVYILPTSVFALNCDLLAPAPPKNTDESFTGKLDAKVDGVFKKLFSGSGDVEGTYRNVAANVLKELPNADKLYMWERVLYLECQVLSESRDLTSKQKLEEMSNLFEKARNPEPPIGSHSINNNGNNNVIIQGSGNSVNGK